MCLCAQIEELGSEGRVEEAQGMMKLVDQLKEEREDLNSTPSVSNTSRFKQTGMACLIVEGTDMFSCLSDD